MAKCKGKTEEGKACKYKAVLDGYCKIHSPKRVDGIPETKKIEKPKNIALDLLVRMACRYLSEDGINLDSKHDELSAEVIAYLVATRKASPTFIGANNDILAEVK